MNNVSEEGEDFMAEIKEWEDQDISTIKSVDDSLLREVELPLEATYYPLGFAVAIRTNSKEVLAAAEESWNCFPSKLSADQVLQLNIGVLSNTSEECPPVPVCRGQQDLLSIVADNENFAVCDLRRGFAFLWLSRGAVKRRPYLRYHFLEATALCMLAASHTTPLHGACVMKEGHGVLLCGDSGAGKSTLAFACARRGWTYISDDATYLVLGRKDRLVVGNSHQVRFRPSAAELFSELEGLSITPRAAGKPSIEISTQRMPQLVIAGECGVDQIIFLNRKDCEQSDLVLYPKDVARKWFLQAIFGTGEMRDLQIESIDHLIEVPIYELRYQSLEWAVDRLDQLVREGK